VPAGLMLQLRLSNAISDGKEMRRFFCMKFRNRDSSSSESQIFVSILYNTILNRTYANEIVQLLFG
jgi:hypothetical protein